MSSKGVFFQEKRWLHILLYFLHFGSWPFNLLIFSMKVLKLFWEKTSWKWKLLCIWLKTKLAKPVLLLLKFCVKNAIPTWLTQQFVWIFIKKTLGHFFLSFWNEICYKLFNFLYFFFSMSTIFLIRRVSSISLYSIYCYRFK